MGEPGSKRRRSNGNIVNASNQDSDMVDAAAQLPDSAEELLRLAVAAQDKLLKITKKAATTEADTSGSQSTGSRAGDRDAEMQDVEGNTQAGRDPSAEEHHRRVNEELREKLRQ